MSEAAAPIACTLEGASYQARIAANMDLAKRSLLSAERRGDTLLLIYRADAWSDVHAMVAAESKCCAFLAFNMERSEEAIRVAITVPERASNIVDDVFAQFAPSSTAERSQNASCCAPIACESSCDPAMADETSSTQARNLASAAAMTAATGAIACGVCCVLPFAWPAVTALGVGAWISWLGKAQREVTLLAAVIVVAAWVWVAWHASRHNKRISRTTLLTMSLASLVLMGASSWPRVEPHVIRMLK